MSLNFRVKYFFTGMGVVGCILLGFAIPTSRALFNIASLLIILGWVGAGDFKIKWRVVRESPLFWPIVAIWALLFLGAFYSSAAWSDVIEHWSRYSKFFLVFMILGLLRKPWQILWTWYAFIAACGIVLVSTYLNIFFYLPWSKTQSLGLGANHYVFIDHIAQSLVMGMFAALSGLMSWAATNWLARLFWGGLCVAASLSIVLLISSLIGYAVLLSLCLVIPALILPRRNSLLVTGAILVVVLATFFWTEHARTGITEGVNEWMAYPKGEIFSSTGVSSTGVRLHIWRTSFELWMQAPWFGHGTGAYHGLAKAAFNNDQMCLIGCFHPHNQFLFFAVDHGLAGVLAFFGYLVSAIWIASRRTEPERAFFLAFVVILLVDSLGHGPLWLFMESYFSFGVMALLASGPTGLFQARKMTFNSDLSSQVSR